MEVKSETLFTKKQVMYLFSRYPDLKLEIPKKGLTLYINSTNGLITVTKSDKKSTDNKPLWSVKAY